MKSIKHFLKLIPARFRWHSSRVAKYHAYRQEWADYKRLEGLHKQFKDEMIRAQRVSPGVAETYRKEGRFDAINQIING